MKKFKQDGIKAETSATVRPIDPANMSGFEAIQIFFPGQLRLHVAQVAQLLGRAEQTVRNQIAANDFPIFTYLDGRARFADVRDVAAHLDAKRAIANAKSPAKRRVGRPTKAEKMAERANEGGV